MAVNRFDTARQQQEVGLQTINTFAALPVDMIDKVLKRKQGDIDSITSDVANTEAAAATIKSRVADEWVKKDIIKDVSSSIDDFYTKHGSDIGSQQAQMDWSKLKSGFINNEKVNNVVKLYNQQEEVDKKRLAMDDANTVKFHEAWKDETAFNTDGSLKDGFTSTDIGAETRVNTHEKQQEYFKYIKASGGEWGKMQSLIETESGLGKDFLAMHMTDGKLSTEGAINKVISADGINKANQAVDNYITSKEGVQQVKEFTHEALKKLGYSGIRDMQLGKVPEDDLKRINAEARKEIYYDMFNTSNEFRNTQTTKDRTVIGQRPQEQAGSGAGFKEAEGLNTASTVSTTIDTNLVDEEYPDVNRQSEGNVIKSISGFGIGGIDPFGKQENKTQIGSGVFTPQELAKRASMGVVALSLPLTEDGRANPASKLPVFDKAVHVALGKNGLMRKEDAIINISTRKPATPAEVAKVDADAKVIFDGIKQTTSKTNLSKKQLLEPAIVSNVNLLLNNTKNTLRTAMFEGKEIALSNEQLMLLAAHGTPSKGKAVGNYTIKEILNMKTEDAEEALSNLQELDTDHPYSGKTINDIMKTHVFTPQTANSKYTTGNFVGSSSVVLAGVEIAVQGFKADGTNKQTRMYGVTEEQNDKNKDIAGRVSILRLPPSQINVVYDDGKGKQSATGNIRVSGDGNNTPMKKVYTEQEAVAWAKRNYDYDINNGLSAKTAPVNVNGQQMFIPKAEYYVKSTTNSQGKTVITREVRPVTLIANGDSTYSPRVVLANGVSSEKEYEDNVGFEDAARMIAEAGDNQYGLNTDGSVNMSDGGRTIGNPVTAELQTGKVMVQPTYKGQLPALKIGKRRLTQ
jgi:hypothetical protein